MQKLKNAGLQFNAMAKRGNKIGILLYFLLVGLLLLILVLHAFNIYALQTDTFTRYIIALLFVLLLLPLVPKIKLFDIIEVKREGRMFKASKKK